MIRKSIPAVVALLSSGAIATAQTPFGFEPIATLAPERLLEAYERRR